MSATKPAHPPEPGSLEEILDEEDGGAAYCANCVAPRSVPGEAEPGIISINIRRNKNEKVEFSGGAYKWYRCQRCGYCNQPEIAAMKEKKNARRRQLAEYAERKKIESAGNVDALLRLLDTRAGQEMLRRRGLAVSNVGGDAAEAAPPEAEPEQPKRGPGRPRKEA